MAGNRLFVMLLTLCAIPILSLSQNISINVLINPNPSPYINDWKSNPAALGSIVINNQTGARDVKIRAAMSLEGSGTVFKCVTGRIRISPLTTLTADKFLRFDDVEYPNEGVRNKVAQSGRLPEGSYNLCLRIEDMNGFVLTTSACGNFIINYPMQPQLIAPMNNSDQYFQTTTFQWTPVLVPGAFTIHYVLKIAELLPGQTPNQALSANYPFFLKEDLKTNMFLYVNSGQPFHIDKKYAWQVQVLDQYGLAPTTNNGKSEIFVFTYRSASIAVKKPKIIGPANTSTVTTPKPEFKWSYDLHGSEVKYKIALFPINAYETAEYAAQNHTPIYVTVQKGVTSYTPSENLVFGNNGNFALRIQVVENNGIVVSSSDVVGFKFLKSQPNLVSPVQNGIAYHYKQEFKWSDEYYSTSVKYRLKVVEKKLWQSTIDAVTMNAPIYTKTVAGMLNHVPDVNVPYKEKQMYAYIVHALDKDDNILASSGVNVFSFNEEQEQTSTVSGSLYYEFADMGEYILQPMPNTLVKLVVRHIFKVKTKTNGKQTVDASGETDISDTDGAQFKDNNKVLGWCGTGAGGAFSFSFNNKDSLGQIVKKGFTKGSVSGEFIDYKAGDVYKVARLMLVAPQNYYYASPKDQIGVIPGKSVTVSQAICYVRSYKTVFTLKPQVNNKNQVSQVPISDMDVYLLRKTRPSLVPADEGKPRPNAPASIQNYEVIAKGKTSILSTNLGQVTFSRMVRNRDNNDEYYLYAKSDPEKGFMNYETSKIPVKFTFPYDKTIFSDEYVYPTVSKDIFANPLPPSVWGTVTRSDNGAPMKDAKVYLYKNDDVVEAIKYSGADGYFPKFSNLSVELSSTGFINGPRRDILVAKPGYSTFKAPIVGKGQNEALLLGEKSFKPVVIKPGMKVQGSIVDETGSGVSSDIKIGEGPFVPALTSTYYPDPNHWNPATFACAAEVGYDLPVIIKPRNHAYFDEELKVHTIGWNAPKKFTVYRKLHRIKLYAVEKTNAGPPAPINGVRFRLKVQNGWYDKYVPMTTNSYEMSFENDDSVFSVQVFPPDGKYFEPVYTTITNSVSKTTKAYTIGLKKASFISGKVVVGTEKQPVPSAHVFVDQGNTLIETYTNAKGEFLLKNVPVNVPITVWAAKHSTSTTYIGDSMKVTVPVTGKPNMEFVLKTYDGIDITNLFGFPIEVASLNDQAGKIRIKGRFLSVPKNKQFELSDPNESIGFDSVYIKASTKIKNSLGVPIAEPVNQIVQTNRNSLDIKVFNTFSAQIYDNKIGVHLVDAGTGKGVVKGEVNIKAGAFNTQGKVSPLNFYLWNPNAPITAANVKIPVLTPDGTDPVPTTKGFRALTREGKSIAFTVNEFKTKVDSMNSYLNGDSLKIGVKLLCAVPGFSAAEQAVDIGSLVIHPNGVDPIESKKPLAIPLKSANADWSINAQEWSFVNDLVISKGVVRAAKIDVPIKTMTINKNSIVGKQFDMTTMNIAKTIPLHITGDVIFDYNVSDNWYLFLSQGSGDYGSYVTDLPGMNDTAKIYFQAIKTTSFGKTHITPWSTQPPIAIHSVTKLSPDMVDFYDEAITVTGLKFDPVIPDYSGTSSVKFETNTGSTKLTIMPFNIQIFTQGVLLQFGVTPEQAVSQVLNQNGFKSYGTVSEPGKFKELHAWMYHSLDSTSIVLESPMSPDKKSNAWQTLAIGASKTYLDKLTGRMPASQGAWEQFAFEGDLTGTKGVTDAHKRMSFIVKGEVEANNQRIGIKNIPTPFGGLKLTYDFENQRLDGVMQIDQDAGGVKLYGAANLRIDADGWYFFAGGNTTIPGGSTVKMAMLFGDYPRMEPFVKDEFAKTSYKKTMPDAYAHSISGFLVAGSAAVPILIPNFSLPLVVVTVDIGHLEGLDTRFWCSFDSDGSEFGVGNIGFVKIWAVVQSIICTEMGGSVNVDVGYTGTYKTSSHELSLDACTSISLKAWLKQRTPFVSFDGTTCIEPTLFDIDESFDFRATIHMDSNGGSNYTIEKGTCHD